MRMGKKKQPTYRVVAADSRKARNGRFIEILGTYNPRHDPSLIDVDNERALHWLRHGAQPSERVQKLLVISGAWEEFTGKAANVEEPDRRPAKVTTAASAEIGEQAAETVSESTEQSTAEQGVPDQGAAEQSAEAEQGVPDQGAAEQSAEAEQGVPDQGAAEQSAEAEQGVPDQGAAEQSAEAEQGAPEQSAEAEQDVEKAEDEKS